MECEIIRDLLPLYVDDICSEKSREVVEEHLKDCEECSGMLKKLRSTEIESGLQNEKQDVLSYGVKKFRQLSAKTGITVSGLFMIPILALLAVNLINGLQMGWFLIVIAGMAVAASVIAVPILVPEDKLFWTFCAFTASLQLLLGITCLVSHGNWFWVASGATLFGLAVCFLPFVIRARPLRRWLEGRRKGLIVLGVDALLFLNMMNAIRLQGQSWRFWLVTGIAAAVTLVVLFFTKHRASRE